MELLPDADACSASSQEDGAHCGRTLDGQNDTGWLAETSTNQSIAYDLKATHTVTGVCLVWDWSGDDMFGATSVRVDTSDDGSTWTTSPSWTYDETDGMLAGNGDPSSLPDVMDACFAISPVETQHIRLFFEEAFDVYLGIAEVRFVELRGITSLEEASDCLSLASYSYTYSYGSEVGTPANRRDRRLGAGAIDEESAFDG
jgi:hypothetical protein